MYILKRSSDLFLRKNRFSVSKVILPLSFIPFIKNCFVFLILKETWAHGKTNKQRQNKEESRQPVIY